MDGAYEDNYSRMITGPSILKQPVIH